MKKKLSLSLFGIGGDSLAHGAVTGMVAGKNAAAYAKKK